MGSQPLRVELIERTPAALGPRPSACKANRPVNGRGQGRSRRRRGRASASLEAGRSPGYFQHSCSDFRAGSFRQSSGVMRRENADTCSLVITRLVRNCALERMQYSRDSNDWADKPRRTGSPHARGRQPSVALLPPRHCERSEAIHLSRCRGIDCFAALAMTR
jgi:hypothetical protein